MAGSNGNGSEEAASIADVPSLNAEHRRTLREGSGISDEVIRLRGYRTVTDAADLRALHFARQQARVPGLLLPVHCTDGSNGPALYRPDAPRSREDRRKRNPDGTFKQHVIKYEMPKAAAVRLDCPPLARAQLADPNVPLWITEGQKKADSLVSRGLCAIALLGVWNWKGKNSFGGITFLADWDYICLKGRDTRIVFDSDVMTKAEVRAALDRLIEHLQRKGARVSAVYLPAKAGTKVGVDDYLLDHTVAELEGLIEGPRPKLRAAAPIVELLEEEPLTMRRPIALINDVAYVAIWPYVRVTVTEELDASGNVVRFDEPNTVEERRLLVMREDGMTFGEGGLEPMKKLGINVLLPEIPLDEKLWSVKAIKSFRSGERPDPKDVLERITDVIDRFIDFDRSFAEQRTMAELVACYVLASWFLDAFNVIGYLWSNGERGSGKTQLLLLVGELSYLGQVILAGGSYASLRDLADYGAALAFDDAENLVDPRQRDLDKRALLLAGNRRGNKIALKELAANKTWRTRYVSTFCPRLFSAIRLPDPVLASRTIVIPLVKTADRYRANADALDYPLWPHDKRKLVDDCWALSLCHLRELTKYEALVNEKAELTGRTLEPWRAILAVAAWLTDRGVEGLYKRLHAVSLNYQVERDDMEQTDLTRLVIRALKECLDNLVGDVLTFGDVSTQDLSLFIKTQTIADSAKEIAQRDELAIDPDKINSRRIGWVLLRLRIRKSREPGTGQRGWKLSPLELQKFLRSFNITADNNVT